MAQYFSARAFSEVGDLRPQSQTSKRTWAFGYSGKFRAERAGEITSTPDPTPTERVNSVVKTYHNQGRHVAVDIWSAVGTTQIIDTIIDLETGVMPFMWIPGSEFGISRSSRRPVEAFWGTGEQEGPTGALGRLVLLGSLDNLTGRQYSYSNGQIAHGYPSDPWGLAELLATELDLDVDVSVAESLSGYERAGETRGRLATFAAEQTLRAREPKFGVSGPRTWVRSHWSAQRVVATIDDLTPPDAEVRVVLARPILIESSI